MSRYPKQKTSNCFQQSGFTLIELMLAMTLSIVVLLGISQVFVSNKQSYTAQEGMSRLQENARFAMAHLIDDISAAGHLGCISTSNTMVQTVETATSAAEFDFSDAIAGTDNNAVGPSGEDWDSITLYRTELNENQTGIAFSSGMINQADDLQLDSSSSSYAALKKYDILAIGDCQQSAVLMITNDPALSNGTIEHNTGIASISHSTTPNDTVNSTTDLQHIFGAGTTSIATAVRIRSATFDIQNNSSGVPVLRRNGTELVEGIQGLSVLYGEDLSPFDLTADRYAPASTITAADTWNNVTSVRITLTVSSVVNAVNLQPLTKNFTTTIKLRNQGI